MSATTKNFEQGKDEVARLCEHFARNQAAFCAPGRKEAHIRQDLIDPFFRALGWDVGNAGRVAPQYCEVVVEDSLDVEGQQKAPDYTFRVGTLPKFYVEAKKCGVNIFADPAPAYQLRRYGWSAKVAVSILTDFEELGVYDCTQRPRPADKAGHARILYYRFDEYPGRWRELWDIFSREAVWTGAFDQYAASKRKRGTSEVDVEFLKEIEGWRDELARNIALRNASLSGDELNRAVQVTIDRVVFLRMAEDRGLEPCQQLLTLCEQGDIYGRFIRELCRKADDKYNSGLFHFQKEPGVSEAPDQITPQLTVDDKAMKPILQSLYFEHGSPYHFGVLPVEILGTVYERFLGKVIRLTAGHQAKVEEKPEVRKAGGVYYTPAYIVDYIVRQTVGRQIEGKSPAQLAGIHNGKQPLRVLDMACGSGSFLLGAYKCLLDHAAKWYAEHNPKRYKSAVYRDTRSGDWRLTIMEKKRILTSHIFGVDIDPQAVEVSKLSLLLKVLEGESAESVGNTMRLFHERALPNLSDNIKCGNSLIGPDYFTGDADRLFDEQPDADEFARVNAFDWQREFPSAMKAGGFNCVIGNPPYVDIIGIPEEQRAYFAKHYATFSYRSDILCVFFHRGIELLREYGTLGFITSNVYFTSTSASLLRRRMVDLLSLDRLLDIGGGVFQDANVDTAILIGTKCAPRVGHKVAVASCVQASRFRQIISGGEGAYEIAQQAFGERPNCTFEISSNSRAYTLVKKVQRPKRRLGDSFEFCRGYTAYDAHRGHSEEMIRKRVYHATRKKSAKYKKELVGSDIGRFRLCVGSPLWVEFGDNLAAPRDTRFHTGPRVWIQRIRNPKLVQRLVCYYTSAHEELAASGGLTIGRPLDGLTSAAAVCGLLNSRLINWFYRQLYNDVNIKPRDLKQIPIPANWDKCQTPLSALVQQMQNLFERESLAQSERQQTAIRRQIEATDAEIDRLVYDLYGLTKEEIAIVEGAGQLTGRST